jgi:hypothetical protein
LMEMRSFSASPGLDKPATMTRFLTTGASEALAASVNKLIGMDIEVKQIRWGKEILITDSD